MPYFFCIHDMLPLSNLEKVFLQNTLLLLWNVVDKLPSSFFIHTPTKRSALTVFCSVNLAYQSSAGCGGAGFPMQEKETHERKRSIVGGRFGKVHHCILVCDSSVVLNQVLAPAAIVSTWTAGNDLRWGKKKGLRKQKRKGWPLLFWVTVWLDTSCNFGNAKAAPGFR